MNGIVGLKPSLGLLAATGIIPACRTLDTISVFARDVELAVRVTAAAAGYDEADPYSRNLPAPSLGPVMRGLRIGVPRSDQRLFFGDAAAEAAYAADLGRSRELGADIVELDFEIFHTVARLLYEGPGWPSAFRQPNRCSKLGRRNCCLRPGPSQSPAAS